MLFATDSYSCRHGARLDKTDSAWCLNSPKPYDSPLTHHGWKQSVALGMRIGSILHQLEQQATRVDSPIQDTVSSYSRLSERSYTTHKKRLNVVMHSSPYLRCTQTALAVSEGITCAQAKLAHLGLPEQIQDDHEEDADHQLSSNDNSCKIKLRIDAFLGEWLNSGYFEHMHSSPDTAHLTTAAKADLLRKPEMIDDNRDRRLPHTPLLETFDIDETEEVMDDGQSIAANNTTKENLQKLKCAGSQGVVRQSLNKHNLKLPTNFRTDFDPSKALETNPYVTDKIVQVEAVPSNVVDRAKSACIEIDSQWDSTAEPLIWGNGGELGEKWGEMHARFATGMERMLKWYANGEAHHRSTQAANLPLAQESEQETVLIIVTHGAGCNALIGALTNQPVLIDVNTSSLTMFARKLSANGEPLDHSNESISGSSLSDEDPAMIYDLRILAETEHLQSGTDPTRTTYNCSHNSRPLFVSGNESQREFRETRNQLLRPFTNCDIGKDFPLSNQPPKRIYDADLLSLEPRPSLSPQGHLTNLRFWSDLVFARKGADFEDSSDSGSDDNFTLNFSNV